MSRFVPSVGRASLAVLALFLLAGAGTAQDRLIDKPGLIKLLPPELASLLPETPKAPMPWLVSDLTKAPEVGFQKAERVFDQLLSKHADRLTPEEHAKISVLREKSDAGTAKLVAAINQVNQEAVDEFVRSLIAGRSDLAGLPWAMGDACRLKTDRSRAFVREVAVLRNVLRLRKGEAAMKADDQRIADFKFEDYDTLHEKVKKIAALKEEEITPARIGALMQILGPASATVREGLAKRLATIDHVESTKALARLAVFSMEDSVRQVALAGLKGRKQADYADILLQGLRYPWPAIAENASRALVVLECRDLAASVVAVLDEPDPRAPAARGGRKGLTVREVVKVNHHQNCLLCHSPANAGDAREPLSVATVVIGEIPNPNQPLPSLSTGYKGKKSPGNNSVRVDVTYLRQDFSVMLPVAHAAPWPEYQRFDFLVREREVTDAEAEAYRTWTVRHGNGNFVPANHRAAIIALRGLTGRDAATPTGKAWREVLGL